MAAGFQVVPADMLVSSAGFADLQNWASQIHHGLVGSMDDAAGMAGDDDAGNSFGAKYDPAAQAVVTAVGQAVAQLGGTANGLYMMALNYIRTDSDIADNLTQAQQLTRSGTPPRQLPQSSAPQCDQVPLNVQIPSVIGHNSSTVNEIIAQFWPQGDTGKLRQASSDWKHLAQLISALGEEGDNQVKYVTANSTSTAVDAFTANWAKVHDSQQTAGPLLNSITNAANQLAAACDSYAQAVDDLCSNLEELAAGAGIVTGIGVALTFFTFGGSDAVAGAGDAAIAAEAGDAAAAMAAGIEGSADVAVLEEAEAIINAAMANLSPVVTDAAVNTAGGVVLSSASSDIAALASGPLAPPPGDIGPIPPDPNSPFPDLTPQARAQFEAWMAQMAVDNRTTTIRMPPLSRSNGKPTGQSVIDARAYQLRVAGDTEYSLYTTVGTANGSQAAMDADGVRPQDGAAIEAKYVGQQPGNCSPYRLNNVDGVFDPVYQKAATDQEWEMERYASAVNDPRNRINHVEIDTNDAKAAAYFEAMRLSYGVPGQTRVVQ